ncbi:MAG: chromate transporter, partial [Bacteroidales bacterium]|nr:chromate transporter [Bacteroidales bacterium]
MIATYLRLIWAYLQIGLFGFGGGYAMLSLIQGLVVNQPWCPQITSQTFTDIVAISQMTPGPIGINSATYIGYVATG